MNFAFKLMDFVFKMIDFVFKMITFIQTDRCSPRGKPSGKHDEFCIKNEEICIKNEEFCIKNEEICIKNEEFSIKNEEICINNDNSAARLTTWKPTLVSLMRFLCVFYAFFPPKWWFSQF